MIEYTKRMLSNGMRLLHHFDPMTRMVAVNMTYFVGSRDEKPGKTGIAHFMEHLMFSGSANVPCYDTALQAAGGESNAWTNVDVTNFYNVLPSQNLETALWLESDRLTQLNLDYNSIEVQRSVVTQEFLQRCINPPYGDSNHLMHKLAYDVHPYRWPTIGESTNDIQNTTHADLRQFYHDFYTINNLVLCISGNVSLDLAVELTEKWFGDIKPRVAYNRHYPSEPIRLQPRELTVTRDVPQKMLFMTFNMCGRMHADFVVCDMISDLLANGMSARFTQNILMRSDVFTELDAAFEGTQDPGLLIIKGKLNHNASKDQAEELIESELSRLKNELVEYSEIEKCVNKYRSTSLFENLSYLQKATKLCLCETLGNVNLINDEIEQYRKITPDDIQRVARQLFIERNKSTLFYSTNTNNN